MNDTNSEEQTQQVEKPVPKKTKASGSRLASLAFVLVLLALGLSGYLTYVYYNYKSLFTPITLTTIEQSDSVTEQLLSEISDLEIRQEASVDTQNTLREAIEKINDELGRDRTQWVLAETEQLLIIANHRLQLAHDVETSLAALKTADNQLRALGQPKLLNVRKAIAKEIASLMSLERADLAGVSLQLGSLAESIDKLPIAMMRFEQNPNATQDSAIATSTASQSAQQPQNSIRDNKPDSELDEAETANTQDSAAMQSTETAPAESPEPGFFTQAWHDILGLVRIRTNVENYKPLLPPEQSYFLRENLRLMLSGAQLALLSGNRQIYQDNIKHAHTWISENFDNQAQSVARILQELDELADIQIVTDLPDISASLELLRDIMRQQEAS